jgi:type III secretion protein Q
MASIRPFPLHRLNATHAQALRRLGSGGRGGPIRGVLPDETPLSVRLSPVSFVERESMPSGGLLRLGLEWAGGRMLLDLSEAAGAAWLRATLGGAAFSALPPAWIEPALAHAVERISAVLEPLGRGSLRLSSITALAGESRAEGFHPLWLEVRAGQEQLNGLLQLDGLSLLLISSLMPEADQASDPLRHAEVPVRLRLGIGQTLLSLGELKTVQPRGVVFITEPWTHQPGELLLLTTEGAGRSGGLRALLSGTQLNIVERVKPMSMPAHDEATDSEEALALDRLPVRLTFDLGERILTLAELQALDAGSALSLDRPLQDFVTIRVNGVSVGEGQLVDMDGRLGVMVSRLSIGGLES